MFRRFFFPDCRNADFLMTFSMSFTSLSYDYHDSKETSYPISSIHNISIRYTWWRWDCTDYKLQWNLYSWNILHKHQTFQWIRIWKTNAKSNLVNLYNQRVHKFIKKKRSIFITLLRCFPYLKWHFLTNKTMSQSRISLRSQCPISSFKNYIDKTKCRLISMSPNEALK